MIHWNPITYRYEAHPLAGLAAAGNCAAVYLPIKAIRTDESRFQNRVDAYSAASADQVATRYNANLFDPIVVWRDPKDGHTYVLSGHSRLQGMRQRGAKEVAARYFEGDEAEAIQFARVEANRAANQETLVEDLQAFRLMREGKPERGIKPKTAKELKILFRGKFNKLDAYLYLDPDGKFIQALQQNSVSEYPYLENKAAMVGRLRRENEELTDVHEDDIFNFVYGSTEGNKLNVHDLEELILKRLGHGKTRLFPECENLNCKPLKDLSQYGPAKDTYREIDILAKGLREVKERLAATSAAKKVHTPEERDYLLRLGQQWEKELGILRKRAGIQEKETGLFGLKYTPNVPQSSTLQGTARLKFQPGHSYIDEIKLKFGRKIKFGQIDSAQSVADVLRSVWNKDKIQLQEHMIALYLDQKHTVIGYQVVAEGIINAVSVDMRLLLSPALIGAATSLVIAHNHPSGQLKPSAPDKAFTAKLKIACDLLEIRLLDHIIITDEGYYSFVENGNL